MKVKYNAPVEGIRGMHSRTKLRSTHGFSMRSAGSQVFNTRTNKRGRASPAEEAGKLAMQIILHAFSNLTAAERSEWHRFRMLILREWHVKSQVGPEQTHPKEITYSDLDFFVSCNHHRVLGGLAPVGMPTVTAERPTVLIDWVKRSSFASTAFAVRTTVVFPEAFVGFLWFQSSPPYASPQRHPREGDYFAMATPLTASFWDLESGTNTYTIEGNRYEIPLGRIAQIRILTMNRGGAPYGYVTWRDVIDSEWP